ncbi:MAG TPA: hypothetical protein VIX11_03125, partial [Candidatus Acidoferrum sp.]
QYWGRGGLGSAGGDLRWRGFQEAATSARWPRRGRYPRQQYGEASILPDAPRHLSGLVAGVEIEVGAGRTNYRRAGVLRYDP